MQLNANLIYKPPAKIQKQTHTHKEKKTVNKIKPFYLFLPAKHKNDTLKISHVANLGRNLSGQVIHIQIQIAELTESRNLLRYPPTQRIEMQVQAGQALETTQSGRYLPGETLSLQRNVSHVAFLVACHPIK